MPNWGPTNKYCKNTTMWLMNDILAWISLHVQHDIKGQDRRMSIDFPKEYILIMDKLVKAGIERNKSSLIRNAIAEFIPIYEEENKVLQCEHEFKSRSEFLRVILRRYLLKQLNILNCLSVADIKPTKEYVELQLKKFYLAQSMIKTDNLILVQEKINRKFHNGYTVAILEQMRDGLLTIDNQGIIHNINDIQSEEPILEADIEC